MNNLDDNSNKVVASDPVIPNNDGNIQDTLSLFEKIKSFVGIRANKELSHTSILHAIESAMTEEEGFSFVVDVFKDSFIVQSENGLFRRNFKITSSGKVKLSEENVAVRPEIDFVELKTNEEIAMDKEKVVKELIANEASQFEESDIEWLIELDEKQLEKLTPVADAGSSEIKALEAKLTKKTEEFDALTAANKPTGGDVSKEGGDPDQPQTVEEYISAAPEGMREVLSSGIRANATRRAEFVEQIKANSKNKFGDEVLISMDLSVLENLAALAVTEDYSTRGGPRFNEEDPNTIPEPPQVFDLTRKAS